MNKESELLKEPEIPANEVLGQYLVTYRMRPGIMALSEIEVGGDRSSSMVFQTSHHSFQVETLYLEVSDLDGHRIDDHALEVCDVRIGNQSMLYSWPMPLRLFSRPSGVKLSGVLPAGMCFRVEIRNSTQRSFVVRGGMTGLTMDVVHREVFRGGAGV